MIISMIAAADEHNTLGKEGKLLWHLPEDLKRFKRLTLGHPIIMGRKTFETLPHALPKRINIVVTRRKEYTAKGCIVAHSIKEALNYAEEIKDNDEICIVGGGEIYTLAIPYVNKIELTRVHHIFKGGDAFFPELNLKEWKLTAEESHPIDETHRYKFTYQTYVKK